MGALRNVTVQMTDLLAFTSGGKKKEKTRNTTECDIKEKGTRNSGLK